MGNPSILGIAGSPRSKIRSEFTQVIDNIMDDIALNTIVENMGRDQKLSNTDICLVAALSGVKKYGFDIELVRLKDYVRIGRLEKPDELEALVSSAKGIVIASPVYFGDRSLLVDRFLSFIKRRNLIQGKVVGCVSVGAKRNGGQETTNIYMLKEVNDSGALVVGNGPPISQYGGTGWAGDLGVIREDNFGITTSTGTGRKVAQMVRLLNGEKRSVGPEKDSLRVSYLIVRDSRERMHREMEKLQTLAEHTLEFPVSWDMLDFTRMDILPCKACKFCPAMHESKETYKCLVRNDEFAANYERLINTDAVILCGHYPLDDRNIRDVYQKVLERTRCIRRIISC